MKRGERGSALIETIVVALTSAVVIGGGSSILYLSFAKVWMARAARESAVCLVSLTTKTSCRTKLDRTLRVGLPLGRSEVIEFRKTFSEARVKLGFEIEPASKVLRSAYGRIRFEESNTIHR